jgi:hypothetical protein
MSRIKAVFSVLVLTAMTTVAVPSASAAAKGLVVITGSSAIWQTLALAAFNEGNCPSGIKKVKPPCFHYTGSANFNVNDTRPTKIKKSGGVTATDSNGFWVVWDSAATINVFTDVKVDSVVGDRCVFAQPVCNITAPAGYVWTVNGNKISAALWGADTTPPAAVQALFTAAAGLKVNTGATDIRPEDGAWADCRVNSLLGNGTPGFGDGLDGLGYNTVNAPGTCPQYTGGTGAATLAKLEGTKILTGGTTGTYANVLAFNISGHDPFTNTAIPAMTTISVGQEPVVFVISKTAGNLGGVLAATDTQLQNIFSGLDCKGSEIGGAGNVNAYLREPLSGTMNTTEATVFRQPVETIPNNHVVGASQETGVNPANANNNPLNLPCTAGGKRQRGIGTSEVVADVKASAGSGTDGIAYTFFSYGNVSPLSGANYGYLTVDGQDPIGLPSNPTQQLPAPCFPCSEGQNDPSSQWGANQLSFPSLRSGAYGEWSLLRVVTGATALPNVQALVNGSHVYAVNSTPDYVPAEGVPAGCTGAACQDPGLQFMRAHYQQCDGDGTSATCPGAHGIGPAANNGAFNANNNPNGGDTGGDMGGCVEATPLTATADVGDIQTGPGTTCANGARN